MILTFINIYKYFIYNLFIKLKYCKFIYKFNCENLLKFCALAA